MVVFPQGDQALIGESLQPQTDVLATEPRHYVQNLSLGPCQILYLIFSKLFSQFQLLICLDLACNCAITVSATVATAQQPVCYWLTYEIDCLALTSRHICRAPGNRYEVSPGRDTTEALIIQVILISNYSSHIDRMTPLVSRRQNRKCSWNIGVVIKHREIRWHIEHRHVLICEYLHTDMTL